MHTKYFKFDKYYVFSHFRLQDEYKKSKDMEEKAQSDTASYTGSSNSSEKLQSNRCSVEDDLAERIKYQQELVDLERKVKLHFIIYGLKTLLILYVYVNFFSYHKYLATCF